MAYNGAMLFHLNWRSTLLPILCAIFFSATGSTASIQVERSDVHSDKAWTVAIKRADVGELKGLLRAKPALLEAPLGRIYPWEEDLKVVPLHFAVEYDLHEVVELFLTLGAEVNVQDAGGKSPLHFVRTGAMVRRLLKAGADPMVESVKGESPLEVFPWHSLAIGSEAARELMKAGVELKLREAVRFGWVEEVTRFMPSVSSALHPDLMYKAAEAGFDDVLAVLISNQIASSAESVGLRRLGKLAHCVVEGRFSRIECPEAV